jgi:hypothetical protein
MPLNDEVFAADLCAIFDDMWNAAENNPRGNMHYAKKMAKRINDEIRNGDVQVGIQVDGGTQSGGLLVGAATSSIGKIK